MNSSTYVYKKQTSSVIKNNNKSKLYNHKRNKMHRDTKTTTEIITNKSDKRKKS